MKKIPVRQILPAPHAPAFSGRFKIRALPNILGGQDLSHALHRHDFFFVLAIESGEGTHLIDFTSHQVEDHSIFFLRPGQVHQLELKAGCTGYLMEFDTTFYHPQDKLPNQRLRRASSKNYCAFELPRFEKLLAVLASIFHEFNAQQEGYIEVIKASLDIFFIEFIRQSRNPAGTAKNGSTYAQERLEDFLELLHTHVSTIKEVTPYANLLNLSAYQLNAITKATMNKSAAALISEQVILEAKKYLLATPNQVKDIADLLGYEDTSYFIRLFKRHTGYSPEAFRKNFS